MSELSSRVGRLAGTTELPCGGTCPLPHVKGREPCAPGGQVGVKATGPGEDSRSPEPETKRRLHEPRLTEAYLPKAGNHRCILCPARDKGVSPISTQSNEPVSQDGVWSVKVMSSARSRITPAPFPGTGHMLASVAAAASQPSDAKLPLMLSTIAIAMAHLGQPWDNPWVSSGMILSGPFSCAGVTPPPAAEPGPPCQTPQGSESPVPRCSHQLANQLRS